MRNIKLIIGIIILLLSKGIYGQDKIYLDKNWKPTTIDNAAFYRIIEKKNDDLFYIKDYYINGNLQMDGHVSDLEKETFQGKINWYDKKGKITHYVTYDNGMASGELGNYLSNGIQISKGEYKNERPYEGIIKSDCNCLIAYINYEKGKKISKIGFYANSDQKALERIFFEDRKVNGTYPLKDIFYDKNNTIIGTLFYSKENTNYKDNGVEIIFYEENHKAVSVKTKRTYLNEKINGEEISYHKNGGIWLKGTYENGKMDKGSFLDGSTVYSYKNGIPIGDRISYDDHQNIIARASYKNGEPYNGTTFKRNQFATYKKGEKTKALTYQTSNFKLLKEETVYTGSKSQTNWYDKQGKLLGAGYYNNSKPISGLHIYTSTHSQYKNGYKNGIEKQYSYSGELEFNAMYKNDTIVWKETPNPLEKGFFHCNYKNNEPFDGIEFGYDAEICYENGFSVEKKEYDENYETGEFTHTETIFYEPNSNYKKEKVIIYKNNTSYTLEYKDNKPYNGMYWFNDYSVSTYKDGEETGPYKYFKDNKVIEQGNMLNGKSHGTISFTPIDDNATICTFKNGVPINGTVNTTKEKTTYVNGKREGASYLYNRDGSSELITYKNDIKEGKTAIIFKNDKKFNGIYKNDQPFNGDFYNKKTKIVETYLEGEKHGVFDSEKNSVSASEKGNRYIKYLKKYSSNILEWEECRAIKTNSLISKGYFKNGMPYDGTFITEEKYEEFLITPYKNGKKHGVEKHQVYVLENEAYETLDFVTYKNDKKNGAFSISSKESLPSFIKKIAGVYKDDMPYNGTFSTSKISGLKTISNYKNGKKEGLERSKTAYGQIDSLYYSKGIITKGIQIELLKGSAGGYYYQHYYTNGIKTKTTTFSLYSNAFVIINYTKTGFEVLSKNKEKQASKASVSFSNTTKTKGNIKYTQDNRTIGSFNFDNGKILDGKMELIDKKSETTMTMQVEDKQLVTTINYNNNIRLYLKIFKSNSIPAKITYKDHELLLNGLNGPQMAIIQMKQYFIDGTLAASFVTKNRKPIGTFIDYKENENGTMIYSITHLKEGQKREDAKKIENLSYDELKKETHKLNQN